VHPFFEHFGRGAERTKRDADEEGDERRAAAGKRLKLPEN